MNVSLLVDGEEIKINEFVEDFFGKTLQGAVSALKEVKSDWKELDIKLKIYRRIILFLSSKLQFHNHNNLTKSNCLSQNFLVCEATRTIP